MSGRGLLDIDDVFVDGDVDGRRGRSPLYFEHLISDISQGGAGRERYWSYQERGGESLTHYCTYIYIQPSTDHRHTLQQQLHCHGCSRQSMCRLQLPPTQMLQDLAPTPSLLSPSDLRHQAPPTSSWLVQLAQCQSLPRVGLSTAWEGAVPRTSGSGSAGCLE